MQHDRFTGSVVGASFIPTVSLSLGALLATFLVTGSNLSMAARTSAFLAIAALYSFLCAAFYFWQKRKIAKMAAIAEDSVFSDLIEGKLLALEEANEFFGASLKSADMFRLVASRIHEIVPFVSCVMFMPDEEANFLRVKFTAGENARAFLNYAPTLSRSLAVSVSSSGKAQLDERLLLEKTPFSSDMFKDLVSAAAVPLFRQERVFAVIVLYASEEYNENSLTLLEAVGERVAPLFASSFAFEQNISNALTDSLTDLPNERAFFLVLENQIAEAHRYREERPLTILAIDIRSFAELNQKLGHSTGDQILTFAARLIKKQLRQMDVLSRSTGDEFWAVLPTANEKIALEVIERVKRAFVLNPFELTATEKIYLDLNFGAATFWRDGETVAELLQTASLKKIQNKSVEPGKVLWFPKEFVN